MQISRLDITDSRSRNTASAQDDNDSSLRDIVDDNVSKIHELSELHRPAREAVDAELATTPAGKRARKAAATLQDVIDSLYKEAGGKKPGPAVRRAVNELRATFRERHRAEIVRASLVYPDVYPSIETIGSVLFGGARFAREQWLAEVRPFQGLLLTTKLDAPTDASTSQQGLSDSRPTPEHLCVQPPFQLQGSQDWEQASSVAFASANAQTGHIEAAVDGIAILGAGGGCSTVSWVGLDVDLTPGYSEYTVQVDFNFRYSSDTWAVFGVAGSGADIQVRVDAQDGTPPMQGQTSIMSLVSPVVWGNSANGSGTDARFNFAFTRPDVNGGSVRLSVRLATHAEAWAYLADAELSAEVDVSSICVRTAS